MIILRQKDFTGVARLARIAREEAIKTAHPETKMTKFLGKLGVKSKQTKELGKLSRTPELEKHLIETKGYNPEAAKQMVRDHRRDVSKDYINALSGRYNTPETGFGRQLREIKDLGKKYQLSPKDMNKIEVNYAKNYGKTTHGWKNYDGVDNRNYDYLLNEAYTTFPIKTARTTIKDLYKSRVANDPSMIAYMNKKYPGKGMILD